MTIEKFKETEFYKNVRFKSFKFKSMWKHTPEYSYDVILLTFTGDTYRTRFNNRLVIDDILEMCEDIDVNIDYSHKDRPNYNIHINLCLY